MIEALNVWRIQIAAHSVKEKTGYSCLPSFAKRARQNKAYVWFTRRHGPGQQGHKQTSLYFKTFIGIVVCEMPQRKTLLLETFLLYPETNPGEKTRKDKA